MKWHDPWTDAEKARLTELWPLHGVDEIADALGRSRSSIRSMAGILALPRKRSRAELPERTKEAIRDLWSRDDLTIDGIAEKAGVTRGQITGFAYRERLPMRRKTGQRSTTPGTAEKKPWHQNVRPLGDDAGYRARGCQYIAGRVPMEPAAIEAAKCGESVVEGRPYCHEHLRRCYRSGAETGEVAA